MRLVAPYCIAEGPEGIEVEAHAWGPHVYKGDWPRKDIGAERAMADFARGHATLGRPPPLNATYAFSGGMC